MVARCWKKQKGVKTVTETIKGKKTIEKIWEGSFESGRE